MFPFNCIVYVSEGPGRSRNVYLDFSMHTESAISGRTLIFSPIFSSIRLKVSLVIFWSHVLYVVKSVCPSSYFMYGF